jgi:hypothetical protein
MKNIYIDDWNENDKDNIVIEEKQMIQIFNTFGGGMGGGNKTYYTKLFDKSLETTFIKINMFGELIELNLNHIVEIKSVKVIECYHKEKKEFRVYKIGTIKEPYSIKYGYNTNCNDDRIYREFDYEK